MALDKLLVLVFLAMAIALWILSIKREWAGRIYDRRGPDSMTWHWMRALGIPRNRPNCVKFTNAVSLFGIVATAISAAVIVIFS